jgi:carbon-monoxide dehydrogenase large subunit
VVKLAKHLDLENVNIKGVGEAATTGLPPAVIRALEKAIGKRLRNTPVHQDELASKR